MTQDSEQEQFKDACDVRCMENISQAMSDEEPLLPTSFHPTPMMFVSAWLTSHNVGGRSIETKSTMRTHLLRAREAVDLVEEDDGAPVGARAVSLSLVRLFIRGKEAGQRWSRSRVQHSQ